MSCPYFDPVAPCEPAGSSQTAMLPLGDRWNGLCRAVPGQPCTPADSDLSVCNLGYARESCPRFPQSGVPDAVRFTIMADSQSSLRLYYVVERDHHPYTHGPLECTLPSGNFASLPHDDVFAAQARAYVASYQRRKFAAGSHQRASVSI